MPASIFWPRATWHKYRDRLEDLVIRYPSIFGDYQRGSVDFDDFGFEVKGRTALNEWGCVWYFLVSGLEGQVIKHPLEDWSSFDSFKPPKFHRKRELHCSYPSNWKEIRANAIKARKDSLLTFGCSPHGFLFQRLYYLRGFKNLMMDFATEHPRLQDLIKMVLDYDIKMIDKWLEIGVDVMVFGDDLGTQDRLTISPKAFRKYLIPAYTEIFRRVRESGAHVYLHSDGHIMEIAEDLIQAGVTILNLQDKVNGLDNIAKNVKERFA